MDGYYDKDSHFLLNFTFQNGSNFSDFSDFKDFNNMHDSHTLTESFFEYHMPEKIVLLAIYSTLFLMALIGNVLVLVMVCINKRFRRNIANFFLVNLAIADLLGKFNYKII